MKNKIIHRLYVDKKTGTSISLGDSGRLYSSCGDSVDTYFDEEGTLQVFDALYNTPERIVTAALNFFQA